MNQKIKSYRKYIWLILCGAFILMAASFSASDKITIGVIDFKTSQNLSGTFGAEIAERIRIHLGHINRFEAIDKKQMNELLNQKGFLRPSGCRSIECHSALFDSQGTLQFLEKCGMPDHDAAIEIGNMLMVDKVVIGLVNKLKDRYTVSVKIIDIATSQVEVTDQISCQFKIHDLEERIDELAARLAGKIPNYDDMQIPGRKRNEFSDLDGNKKGMMLNFEGYGEIKDMKDLRAVIQNRIKEDEIRNGLKGEKAGSDKEGIKSPINDKDFEQMVFVPAGTFIMGSGEFEGEGPAHEVYLDAFYIDKYEITNFQYAAFLKATGKRPPPTWGKPGFNRPDQPVTGVNWEAANEYAAWAGKRLPAEAEWEKAAHGAEKRKYPWGDDWANGRCHATIKDPLSGPAPVGSYPEGASPYGCHDMAGNVWEWCADWFSAEYYIHSEHKNPIGPQDGSWHVLRGGGWESLPDEVRTTIRRGGCPDGGYICAGFRCVKDAINQKVNP